MKWIIRIGGIFMNIQRLFECKKVVYSLEVFPPKKTTSIDTIYNTLYGLRGLRPDFISERSSIAIAVRSSHPFSFKCLEKFLRNGIQ